MKVLLACLFLLASTSLAKTITVAVIDTGIDASSVSKLCKFGHKAFTGRRDDALKDTIGHGTHIAGLIQQHAGEDADYCMVSLKWFDEKADSDQNLFNLQRALRYAINIKVDFINISGGGIEPNPTERSLIIEALNKGIKVVVAAGNEGHDLTFSCNYFPACYDSRLVVVGNLLHQSPDKVSRWAWVQSTMRLDSDKNESSNYGAYVNRWEVGTDVVSKLPGGITGTMTGTSQATAIATGKLIKERLAR